jgi:hypothetical protein
MTKMTRFVRTLLVTGPLMRKCIYFILPLLWSCIRDGFKPWGTMAPRRACVLTIPLERSCRQGAMRLYQRRTPNLLSMKSMARKAAASCLYLDGTPKYCRLKHKVACPLPARLPETLAQTDTSCPFPTDLGECRVLNGTTDLRY